MPNNNPTAAHVEQLRLAWLGAVAAAFAYATAHGAAYATAYGTAYATAAYAYEAYSEAKAALDAQ
jgi:hypothetical protein